MKNKIKEKEWIPCDKCGLIKHRDKLCVCEREEKPTREEDIVGNKAFELGQI